MSNVEKMRRYRARHPESNYELVKAWRLRHPEEHRARTKEYQRKWRIHKKWGLSSVEWGNLVAAQGDLCAICKKCEVGKNLHIDHCHDTQRIRGLLCGKCNRGLGMFLDDPELLQVAADYLRSTITWGFTFKLLEDARGATA